MQLQRIKIKERWSCEANKYFKTKQSNQRKSVSKIVESQFLRQITEYRNVIFFGFTIVPITILNSINNAKVFTTKVIKISTKYFGDTRF